MERIPFDKWIEQKCIQLHIAKTPLEIIAFLEIFKTEMIESIKAFEIIEEFKENKEQPPNYIG